MVYIVLYTFNFKCITWHRIETNGQNHYLQLKVRCLLGSKYVQHKFLLGCKAQQKHTRHVFRAQQKPLLLVIRAQQTAYLKLKFMILAITITLTYEIFICQHYMNIFLSYLGILLFHVTGPLKYESAGKYRSTVRQQGQYSPVQYDS